MHDITHWATEFVNPLLAFQQVKKFGPSRLIFDIPFLQQLLMRNTSLVARSRIKKNPIRLLFYL